MSIKLSGGFRFPVLGDFNKMSKLMAVACLTPSNRFSNNKVTLLPFVFRFVAIFVTFN